MKLSKTKYLKQFQHLEAEKLVGIQSLSTTGLGDNQTSHYTKDKIELRHSGLTLPNSSRVMIRDNLKYEGYLGIDYLDEYDLTINSLTDEYVLEKFNEQNTKEGEKSYGVSMYLVDDRWKVIGKDGNDNNLNDIKIMDAIQKIDELPISNFKNTCSFRSYIKSKKTLNENMTITIKNRKFNLFLRTNKTSAIDNH